MKRSELYFNLPTELIAQHPAKPADFAKLLIINRRKKTISEDIFFNLDKYLQAGDVLVFNDSKVLPARLIGKKETGGKVEALLLRQIGGNIWEAMLKNPSGEKIVFGKNLAATYKKTGETYILTFNQSGPALLKTILLIGKIPTPPYIKSQIKNSEYQNIFAKKLGSAAAPTAGLHFTKRLIAKLNKKGVQTEFVTLHVGLGTFQPVRTDKVEEHQIHSEHFEISAATLNRLRIAKSQKRRIIAVGTTSCRVLETVADSITRGSKKSISGETKIFIYPGYKFQAIDGLITNFHTPYSSLLALVMALAGKEQIKRAYALAIKKKYKFFSLGDGMFIS